MRRLKQWVQEKIFRNLIITSITNWQVKPLLPVFLLVLSFMGCEPEDLELGLPPKDNVFEVNYLEQTFEPKMVWNDTIPSAVSRRLMVGSYFDDYFGRVNVSSYFSLAPINVRPPVIRDNITVDSMVMNLRYNYIFNDEATARLDMQIHTLENSLEGNTAYYTFDQQEKDHLVGTYVESYPIKRIRYPTFLEDTTHYIKIFFDRDFATEVLDTMRNTPGLITESEEDIKPIIPGFSLTAAMPGTSGIFGFDTSDSESRVTIYYTTASGSQTTVNFALSQVQHYNHISPNTRESDFSGTVAANMTAPHQDFDPGGEYVYYQSGTGMEITFDVGEIKNIGDTLKNFMVNSAVLELQNIPINSNISNPPSNLRMLLTDDTHKQKFFNNRERTIYQNSRSDSIALSSSSLPQSSTFQPLTYIVGQEKYQADITFFVQGLFEGRGDLTKILLKDISTSANEVNSFRVKKEDIKIRIYYTKSKL